MRRLYDEAAEAALESPTLVPPPQPASLGDGATSELRDAMARFTVDDTHAARRAAVREAIDAVDVALLTREVRDRTRTIVTSGRLLDALTDIASVVPTQALLAALGVDDTQVPPRADDVRAVVGAIGRGEPATPTTDASARRLDALFATTEWGPVAAISMLYQNHDATAALVGSVLLARTTGESRPNSLARTVRYATDETVLADELVTAGETVEVSLDGDGTEFGVGPHACPGEALAVAIVEAIIWTLDDLDVGVDAANIALGADGRPTALPLISTGDERDQDGTV